MSKPRPQSLQGTTTLPTLRADRFGSHRLTRISKSLRHGQPGLVAGGGFLRETVKRDRQTPLACPASSFRANIN